MEGESSQPGAVTSYTSSDSRRPEALLSGIGPKSYWVTSEDDDPGARPPHAASAAAAMHTARQTMYTVRSCIGLARTILEARLARTGLAALRSEDEGLRIVVEGVEHAVEHARVALQLLDQHVDSRQRFLVEGARRDADVVQARRHAIERGRARLQRARQLADIG